jgi:hypothetical protein
MSREFQKNLIEFLYRFAPTAAEWALMLAPVAVYVLYLAYAVYRPGRPVLRTGNRNTLELAFAASGFLLIGPPTWILSRLQIVGPQPYFAAYLVYVVVLLGVLTRELRRSRNSLLVFNVNPFNVASIMERVLKDGPAHEYTGPGQLSFKHAEASLNIDVAPWWRCCTVWCRGQSETIQQDLRSKLLAVLSECPGDDNVVGAVLSLVGGFLLLVVTLFAMLFIWYLVYLEN